MNIRGWTRRSCSFFLVIFSRSFPQVSGTLVSLWFSFLAVARWRSNVVEVEWSEKWKQEFDFAPRATRKSVSVDVVERSHRKKAAAVGRTGKNFSSFRLKALSPPQVSARHFLASLASLKRPLLLPSYINLKQSRESWIEEKGKLGRELQLKLRRENSHTEKTRFTLRLVDCSWARLGAPRGYCSMQLITVSY